MALQTATTLKGYFNTGDTPTEAQFIDLIDSTANPMTASGDIIYGGTSGAATRLVKGSDTQVLTLASGLPSWAAPAAGGSLIAADITVATATTSVTISDLDGNAAGGYDLTFSGTGDNTASVYIQCNGDTTQSHYLVQRTEYNGAVVTAVRSAGNSMFDFPVSSTNARVVGTAYIDTVGGYFCAAWNGARGIGGTVHVVQESYIVKNAATVSNITSITLVADATNGILAGTEIILKRRK